MSDGVDKLRGQLKFDPYRYLRWLDKFNFKCGLHYPPQPTMWLKQIVDKHKDLQEIIGGHTIKLRVAMVIEQEELSNDKIAFYSNALTKIIPKIWAYYNINGEMLLKWPRYKMTSVIRGVKKTKDIRTSAFIKKYSEKYTTLNDEQTMELNKILELLGIEWSRLKNINKVYYVTVSFSPYAFTKIGHYGADEKSCFRHGRENCQHKYNLASANNSFVFLIKEKIDDKFVIHSRQWGFYNKVDKVFNISNLYHKVIADNVVQKINHKVFEFLANAQLSISTDMIQVKSKIYHNAKKHDWSFYNQATCGAIKAQVL